ncbi:MAG: hypothetical protein KME26_17890 [Oscillatoria princeps RMCB-10]|nr:hypothetical protein [Oscillatoria princeps RMCB-10]
MANAADGIPASTAGTSPHCGAAPARDRSHQRRSLAQQSLMPVLNGPLHQSNRLTGCKIGNGAV